MRRPTLLLALVALGGSLPVDAQDVQLSLTFADRIRVSERSNLSRTEGGRYIGLTNRQITAYLTAVSDRGYEGRSLVFEKTLRDRAEVGRRVDSSALAAAVTAPQSGFIETAGSPRYLGIPALPSTPVRTGDTWEAPGAIITALPNGAPSVPIAVEVSYRYDGLDQWDGQPVHVVAARFGTRYPPRPDDDEEVDPPPIRLDINRITGRHELTILIPAGSSAPLFIRDELEEQYELPGEPMVLLRGHILTFVQGLSSEAQRTITREIGEQLETTSDVSVEETNTGTRITVGGIRFVADQAVILDGEEDRLDSIAAALAAIEGVRYLVVGHTADVGTKESQVDLSWERAQVIVAEFVGRGIDQALFDIEGRGGSEPVAPNTNEDGRARNRRVEIYVLEE